MKTKNVFQIYISIDVTSGSISPDLYLYRNILLFNSTMNLKVFEKNMLYTFRLFLTLLFFFSHVIFYTTDLSFSATLVYHVCRFGIMYKSIISTFVIFMFSEVIKKWVYRCDSCDILTKKSINCTLCDVTFLLYTKNKTNL